MSVSASYKFAKKGNWVLLSSSPWLELDELNEFSACALFVYTN